MVSNGKMVGLNATSFTMPNPSAQTEIAKVDDLTYKMTVKNVPAYIDSVTVPVWSDRGEQDDIVWTVTTKQTDGSYVATVLLAAHKFDSGHHSVQVYGQSKIGKERVILASTKGFTVDENQTGKAKVTLEATAAVTQYEEQAGTLTVTVTEAPAGKQIKTVRVAAWSEKKQENLHWYVTTEVINGQVVLKVDEKYHDYKDGSYTVHTYVDYVDGSVTGFNLGTYDLKAEKSNVILPAYFIDISSHNGNISVDDFKNLK